MKDKFIVVYRFDYFDYYDATVHGFDTLEEAVADRENYSDQYKNKIYQLVEETIKYTLPDGTEVEFKH